MAAKSAKLQRGTPFQPGQSGNPGGRPQGSRNKATLAIDALLEGEAEAITRKAIELALGGDGSALRLCMERIAPPRRDRPVLFELPALNAAADAKAAAAALLKAVALGDLTPGEANELARLVESFVKTVEATEFEDRLTKLELATKA